jgi:hypothetical protein
MTMEKEETRLTPFEKDGKWGFKDEIGKEVIPLIYEEVWDSDERI